MGSLQEPDTRLVTLTGLGGSGKTRVATVAAARLRDESGRTVHFHEVTDRETGDDVYAAVEAMVGDSEPEVPPEERPLVVLDNVDASADGSAAVSRILDDLPAVLLLVTSRVPLRRRSEQTIAVPPLDVPAADASTAEIEESPAVQMFLRIAHQADRTSTWTGAWARWPRCAGCSTASLWRSSSQPPGVRLVGLDGLRESLESGLGCSAPPLPTCPSGSGYWPPRSPGATTGSATGCGSCAGGWQCSNRPSRSRRSRPSPPTRATSSSCSRRSWRPA